MVYWRRVSDPAETIHRVCLELPEVTERLSHGAPTYFIRLKTSFATVRMDGHHHQEFPHLVCAAGTGVQQSLVTGRPDQFFVPAYVGGRGWIGVRLDRGVTEDELVDLCEDAYRTVAPATLVKRWEAERG